MRVHAVLCWLCLAFCLIVRPSLSLVVHASVISFIVFAAEAFNTSLEALTDLAAGGQVHPLAKVAKDTAAGAVLFTAAGALCIAYELVMATFPWHFWLFTFHHAAGAVLSLCVLGATVYFQDWSKRSGSQSMEGHAYPERRRGPQDGTTDAMEEVGEDDDNAEPRI